MAFKRTSHKKYNHLVTS